ncbi:hypothetical protein JNK13_01730 [bacterium]|nr:hypothetical protein [bacterium]
MNLPPQENSLSQSKPGPGRTSAFKCMGGFVFLWVIFLLIYRLHGMLADTIPAGWDLTPHFYLSELMRKYISHGKIDGYDPNWFAGYSAFTFYGPFFYLISNLFFYLSAGQISPEFGFNLTVFLMPFAFLAAVYWTAGKIFSSREVAVSALLFGGLFLTISEKFLHTGIGLVSVIANGQVTAFLGLILFVVLLGLIHGQRIVFGGIIFSALILCHPLTALFAALTLLIWIIFDQATRLRIAASAALGLVLSAWWWIPLARNLWLSSGEKIGLSYDLVDPLIALFPEVGAGLITEFLRAPSIVGLLNLPVTGCLFMLAALVGFVQLLRAGNFRLQLFAWFYLLSVLVVPRNWLAEILTIKLHYYRFLAPIFCLHIFVCAYGLTILLKSKYRVVVAMLCAWAMLVATVRTSDLANAHERRPYYFHIEQYRDYTEAMAFLQQLETLPDSGRIAIEGTAASYFNLGSPHFFSSLIPLLLDRPVLPGLLAESAPAAQLITPLLLLNSNALGWGERKLLESSFFNRMKPGEILERLRLFNVRYILTSSKSYLRYWARYANKPNANLSLVRYSGKYGLFEIHGPDQFVLSVKHKPFLFVDQGGMTFREFSEKWFTDNRLLDYPVIYDHQHNVDLREKDLSAVIISVPSKFPVDQNWLDEQESIYDRSIIVINGEYSTVTRSKKPFFQVTGLESREERKLFADLIHELGLSNQAVNPVEIVKESESLRFKASGPVLINYAYHPRWQTRKPGQQVYMVTPSQILIFADGAEELYFK